MKQDKLYNTLLDLYKEVYSSIGVDFDAVEKEADWFLKYEIDAEVQNKLVKDFLNSRRLSVLEKKVIRTNYYMGCSPKNKEI